MQNFLSQSNALKRCVILTFVQSYYINYINALKKKISYGKNSRLPLERQVVRCGTWRLPASNWLAKSKKD